MAAREELADANAPLLGPQSYLPSSLLYRCFTAFLGGEAADKFYTRLSDEATVTATSMGHFKTFCMFLHF